MKLAEVLPSDANGQRSYAAIEFECPFTGGPVTPTGWDGQIDCPASTILCDEVPCMNFCHGLGNCVNSRCVCDEGWGGVDCGIQCDSSCYNCSGTAATDCTSCPTGQELTNGTCGGCGTCCDPCETCDGANKSSCTSCKNSLNLSGTSCVSTCPSGTVAIANVC